MVFIAPSSPDSTYSDIQGGGMVSTLPSSLDSTDSDIQGEGMVKSMVFKLDGKFDSHSKNRSKALRRLTEPQGVRTVTIGDGTLEITHIGVDPFWVWKLLRKLFGFAELISIGSVTARNDTFPTTVRITEPQEQSGKEQEDQLPPGQADSNISASFSSLLSHPFSEDTKPMEEEGLGGLDQLYDSAIDHLLSGIDGIDKLKRHYDLLAGEMASCLEEADDTAIMLRRQVKELEAKLSMANMPERRLMDMVCTSEDEHARTKMELALMREKMDEANRRIEYLEAEVSTYQNRIVEAEREKEKARERASRASDEGGTMSTTYPSHPVTWTTSLNFFPLLLRVPVSQIWRCARKALFFLDVTSYLDNLE